VRASGADDPAGGYFDEAEDYPVRRSWTAQPAWAASVPRPVDERPSEPGRHAGS
jgi:hypothetical protein